MLEYQPPAWSELRIPPAFHHSATPLGMTWQRITGIALLAAGLLVLTLKLTRVYDPAPALDRLSAKMGPGVAQIIHRVQAHRAVYAVFVILPAGLGAALLLLGLKSKPRDTAEPTRIEEAALAPAPKPIKTRTGQAAIHSCNVLKVGPQTRQLWQFDARNGGFVLNREQTSLSGEPLPSHFIGKDWRTLFQPKLNVAWVPPEHVFLRVAQFPRSEFNETLSMVELQLEKLSPLPVAQIVWSLHVLPHAAGDSRGRAIWPIASNCR